MATLAELWTLMEDPTLKEKVSSACLVAAEAIRTEDSQTANHTNRLKWAKAAMLDPVKAGDDMLKAVLAANRNATVQQIQSANDAAVQSNVNTAVDALIAGGA